MWLLSELNCDGVSGYEGSPTYSLCFRFCAASVDMDWVMNSPMMGLTKASRGSEYSAPLSNSSLMTKSVSMLGLSSSTFELFSAFPTQSIQTKAYSIMKEWILLSNFWFSNYSTEHHRVISPVCYCIVRYLYRIVSQRTYQYHISTVWCIVSVLCGVSYQYCVVYCISTVWCIVSVLYDVLYQYCMMVLYHYCMKVSLPYGINVHRSIAYGDPIFPL